MLVISQKQFQKMLSDIHAFALSRLELESELNKEMYLGVVNNVLEKPIQTLIDHNFARIFFGEGAPFDISKCDCENVRMMKAAYPDLEIKELSPPHDYGCSAVPDYDEIGWRHHLSAAVLDDLVYYYWRFAPNNATNWEFSSLLKKS